ncbi:MAG: helix-turn-helix transcriptional regulator [Eggerthellaceae bacterium]|nr:helix-turn-helix transcriptional regulator [Eggerthellaceae bacterium]
MSRGSDEAIGVETLDIVDGGKRTASPCAQLRYDRGAGTFSIRILPDADPGDLPMLLEPFARRGELEVGDTWARRWVEERIVPASRQNLGEVLKANGLDDYDEFELLLAGEGRSSQDEFVVRSQEASPDARQGARARVGAAVAQARKEAGITQAELARRAGIDQAVVSRLERGQANPTVGLLADIAEALGRTLSVAMDE